MSSHSGSSRGRLFRPQAFFLAVMLALSVALVGCENPTATTGDAGEILSTSAKSDSYDMSYGESSNGWRDDAASSQSEVEAPSLPDQSKVVRNVNAQISSREFEKADEAFRAFVNKYGVLVTSDSYNGYGEADSDYVSHDVHMRVKSDDVDALVEELRSSEAWTVENISVSADDMGSAYADNEARIESLRVRYNFYKEQAEKATDEQAVMDYTERMLNTLSEIESLERENESTDLDVAYSTVSVSLSRDVSAHSLDSSEGVWQTLVDMLTFLPRNIASAFGYLLIFILWLLPLAIIVALIVIVCRFATKAWRKSHPKAEPERVAPRAERGSSEGRRKGSPELRLFGSSKQGDVPEESETSESDGPVDFAERPVARDASEDAEDE